VAAAAAAAVAAAALPRREMSLLCLRIIASGAVSVGSVVVFFY
jgi:hypothetical protein